MKPRIAQNERASVSRAISRRGLLKSAAALAAVPAASRPALAGPPGSMLAYVGA